VKADGIEERPEMRCDLCGAMRSEGELRIDSQAVGGPRVRCVEGCTPPENTGPLVARIDIESTFTELGIDSVKAVRPSGSLEWEVKVTAAWAGWLAPAHGRGETFTAALVAAIADLRARRAETDGGRT
jgi:hypothetical protein